MNNRIISRAGATPAITDRGQGPVYPAIKPFIPIVNYKFIREFNIHQTDQTTSKQSFRHQTLQRCLFFIFFYMLLLLSWFNYWTIYLGTKHNSVPINSQVTCFLCNFICSMLNNHNPNQIKGSCRILIDIEAENMNPHNSDSVISPHQMSTIRVIRNEVSSLTSVRDVTAYDREVRTTLFSFWSLFTL